jgi:3-oxoacyl-[acyl-carrier-protein] synthase III
VFRHAVVNLAEVLEEVLKIRGLDRRPTSTGSCRIRPMRASSMRPPQARHLPPEKVVVTVDRHANTSAASVPLALDVGVRDGRIKPGDLVMLEAMGGGFTWGASLIRMCGLIAAVPFC